MKNREELIKKRELLKKKIQQDERKATISWLLGKLDKNKAGYDLLYENPATEWIIDNFPLKRSTGVDWDRVQAEQHHQACELDSTRDNIIKEVIQERFQPDEFILAVFDNGLSPNIKLRPDSLLRSVQFIAGAGGQVWLASPEKRFCMEINHFDVTWIFLPAETND